MIDFVVVAVGAAVGGPARFLLDRWLQERVVRNHPRRVPVGTTTVNVLGSFILGAAATLLSGTALLGVGTGFCGAFTTFSTFAALVAESWRESWRLTAALTTVTGVVLSVGAYLLGTTLAGALA